MVQTVKLNKAFTLIEMLVAIVIIGISIMGLMEMSTVVMKNNLRNEARNKAIEVLGNHIQDLTSKGYDNIASGLSTDNNTEQIRNISITFMATDNVSDNASTNTKYIDSKISWSCCGKNYSYGTKTVVTKNE